VQQKQKNNMTKRKLLLSLVILAAVLIGIIWKLNHHPLTSTAKTTSKALTAQNNYSAGTSRPNSASTGNSQGGVVDTKGRDVNNASNSQSTPPSSAAITLTSPATGATVMPGDTVSGKASVSMVMFRLIDNDAGVIAQGQMTVVDGKFSGTLRFQPKSSTGQLDIYSTNSLGAEENEIQIPVQFNK
jgi:hypothetical protein